MSLFPVAPKAASKPVTPKARQNKQLIDYAAVAPSQWPVKLSRKDAKANGVKKFFSGRACKLGHVCVRSVGNPVCPLCRRTAEGRRSYVMGQLRGIRYPEKFEALELAFVKEGRNPRTNRVGKLYQCADCEELFGAKEVAIDHIKPVVPVTGWDSWDAVIDRMFCAPEDFQILCKANCHKAKTNAENGQRSQEETPLLKTN